MRVAVAVLWACTLQRLVCVIGLQSVLDLEQVWIPVKSCVFVLDKLLTPCWWSCHSLLSSTVSLAMHFSPVSGGSSFSSLDSSGGTVTLSLVPVAQGP